MEGDIFPATYDTQAGGYDVDGNYYLYDDMEVSHE